MLGFDGVNQTVNVLGTNNQPDGANTEWGGTALLKDWLRPVDGDYTKGWNASPLELGLLSAIGKLPEEQRRAPTAILYLHNEFDSFNAAYIRSDWIGKVPELSSAWPWISRIGSFTRLAKVKGDIAV